MLGDFTLLKGSEEIHLPMSAQRLIALMALRERPLGRAYLASVLWPDHPAEGSLAVLRTALWRVNRVAAWLVDVTGTRLSLRPDVQVDVAVLAHLMSATNCPARSMMGLSWFELSTDLLPDWYDDWLIDERERVRQLRLHALELLSEELSLNGRHPEAIQTALAAVRLEPLRETAHAALIRAHLAEGNRSEALRQFRRCREVLATELAVEPSESIRRLIINPGSLSRSPNSGRIPAQPEGEHGGNGVGSASVSPFGLSSQGRAKAWRR